MGPCQKSFLLRGLILLLGIHLCGAHLRANPSINFDGRASEILGKDNVVSVENNPEIQSQCDGFQGDSIWALVDHQSHLISRDTQVEDFNLDGIGSHALAQVRTKSSRKKDKEDDDDSGTVLAIVGMVTGSSGRW